MSSRLLIHRAVAAVVTILAVPAFASICVAADPPSITGLASRNSLSADDGRQIEEYAAWYTARLLDRSDDATEMRRTRSKLVDVIRRGGTSEIFRDTYSRHVLPGLQKVIAEGTADETVTAVVIASQLGTEQALSALLEHCMPNNESRRHVRLSAARGCGVLLSSPGQTVSTRKISSAARELAVAARKETDADTLRHIVQAIYTATEAGDDESTRDQIHTHLVEVIQMTAERAAEAEAAHAAELLAAIYPVLHRLRARYIVMSPPTQKQLGIEIGPCVRKVLDVPTAHWDECQRAASSGKARQPANIIAVSERFLSTIDRVVRRDAAPPRPGEEKLKDAWEKNDMQGYKALLAQWSQLLSRPPYK